MTRRDLFGMAALLANWPAVGLPAEAAAGPDSFKVYTDAPRLLFTPRRLKLMRRERERRSLRWDQFETLWGADTQFPEFGWTAALRYQIAEDESAGRQAVAWAANKGTLAATAITDGITRQVALIADWCGPLMSAADKSAVFAHLERVIAQPSAGAGVSLADVRTKAFAAIALTDARPAASEKALKEAYEGFWTGAFLPELREGRLHVSNADAYAMLELMHCFRDNLSFDLRDTFPAWFKDYPLIHAMAHYPEPYPAAENEYRIPADPEIDKRGPDVTKATLSRAAELAMVAFDSNALSTQLLQGFLMNDRFLMRGALGITYELLWADPYQPGLSYYHIPLVAHDAVGGNLYVRSAWEDNAAWLGFFGGQVQFFANGDMTRTDPRAAHDPMDLGEAVVVFAQGSVKFQVPGRPAPPVGAGSPGGSGDPVADVFILGLEAKQRYHVETDDEGMAEVPSDVGGIIYLPGMPADAEVRFELAPAL